MVLARTKYSKFLLGYAADNSGDPLEFSNSAFANAQAAKQDATGFAKSSNDATIFSVNASSPYTRAVTVAKDKTLNVRWISIADDLTTFELESSESALDITSVLSEVMVKLPGIPQWEATMEMIATDDLLVNVVSHGAQVFGCMYAERSSGKKLSAAVAWGGAQLTREDSGLDKVSMSIYNIGEDIPVWR